MGSPCSLISSQKMIELIIGCEIFVSGVSLAAGTLVGIDAGGTAVAVSKTERSWRGLSSR